MKAAVVRFHNSFVSTFECYLLTESMKIFLGGVGFRSFINWNLLYSFLSAL